jgi:hypothetical protein
MISVMLQIQMYTFTVIHTSATINTCSYISFIRSSSHNY